MQLDLSYLLGLILFVVGMAWLWVRVRNHPLVRRSQVMRGADRYFHSRIDELPSRWELVRRQGPLMLVALLWIFMFARKNGGAENLYLFLFGLLALTSSLFSLLLDLLALPRRALELTSKGILYLEDHFDFIPWTDIIAILDFEQSIIIKTEEDIFEFTFENDPGDHQRLLEVLGQVRQKHQLTLPYKKVYLP